MLIAKLLDSVLHDQAIKLIDHNGTVYHCGTRDGHPTITLRLTRPIPTWKLLLRPQLTIGEGYMRGDIVIEDGTLRQAMAVAIRQSRIYREMKFRRAVSYVSFMRSLTERRHHLNPKPISRRNVSRHYDIGNDVFEMFLDPMMQYTCGRFSSDALPMGTTQAIAHYSADHPLDLDVAQQRRVDQIIDKLQISEGMSVLDVGCGWGGLALAIAKKTNAHVLGISLSQKQLDFARKKAKEQGLTAQVDFQFLDYRDLQGEFDRIIGAGVLEHVGKPNYKKFFRKLEEVLVPDGIILIDTVGRMNAPTGTNSWIRRYIFPGGYIPALSEISSVTELTRLMVQDVDVSRVDYALTVREWSRRFDANAEQIKVQMGEEFVRMFELYLAGTEMSLIFGGLVNFQVLLGKSRFVAPNTRVYMASSELTDPV